MGTLLETPALGRNRIPLRPYQEEALEAIRGEFARGKRSTLLVLPTGTGKTVTFGNVARRTMERGGKALILAHRGELIDQAANTLDAIGVEAAIEKADQYARQLFEPGCVIATVQTMRGKRLESWDPNHFRVIITDEAHHATADSYQRIYRHFRGARHLGVTATADRADEDSLSDVFESVAYELSLWDAMTAPDPGPFLCRLKVVQCDVKIDLRGIKTSGGDFDVHELERRISPLMGTLANAVRQEVGRRPTLVFTPDVGSAQAMATALQSMGLSADWISGDDVNRADKIRALKAGETQILCNCMLLTEGFDCPSIAAIVLCRPTKSRPLYAQMVGRGTRIHPGKSDCLIIDFDYLTTKHDLVKPVELFDTTHTDDEVMALAQKIASETKGADLLEAIERAEKEHKERQVLRIQAREREIKYRRVSYDPADVYETFGLPWRGKSPDKIIHKATEGQVKYLSNCFKVTNSQGMSKASASTLIDYLSTRRKEGLATMKQVRWAIKMGLPADQARKLTFEEASAYLDSVFKKRA